MAVIKDLDARHPDYEEWIDRWRLCRVILAGEEACKSPEAVAEHPAPHRRIRGRGDLPDEPWQSDHLVLPRLSGHRPPDADEDAYRDYVAHAHLFPGAARAHEGLTGLIMRRAPDWNLPGALEDWAEDVVGGATPMTLSEFCWEVIAELFATGRFGVLVDHPIAPSLEPGRVLEEDRADALGLRPTLRLLQAEEIISWGYGLALGTIPVLSRLVLEHERVAPTAAPQGATESFGWANERYWRVLDRARPPAEILDAAPLEDDGPDDGLAYRVRIFVRGQRTGEFVQEGSDRWPRRGGRLLREVQCDLYPAYGRIEKPPLLDVCTVNRNHMRNSAWREQGLLYAGCPIPFVTGYEESREAGLGKWFQALAGRGGAGTPALTWRIGSRYFLTLRNPTARVGVLSAKDADLSALTTAMEEKRAEMVTLVGRILSQELKQPEAARREWLRAATEHGALSTRVQRTSDVLTRSIRRAGAWHRGVPEGQAEKAHVTINRDFFDEPITAVEAEALARLWVEYGVIAKSDVREAVRQGGLIPPERTDEEIDAELARLGVGGGAFALGSQAGGGAQGEEGEGGGGAGPEEEGPEAQPAPRPGARGRT